MPMKGTTLAAAADLFYAASRLRLASDEEIQKAVKLLRHSNPGLVAWALLHLPRIAAEE